jgi:hypothetical protein
VSSPSTYSFHAPLKPSFNSLTQLDLHRAIDGLVSSVKFRVNAITAIECLNMSRSKRF